jgi:hypothetical protein
MKFKIFGLTFGHSDKPDAANSGSGSKAVRTSKPDLELRELHNDGSVKSVEAKAQPADESIISNNPTSNTDNSEISEKFEPAESSPPIYNSLSIEIEPSLNLNPGIMPRFPERLSEATPLRPGTSSNEEYEDPLFTPQSYRSKRTLQWAMFFGAT